MSPAPSRESIALTAAHGLSDRVIATWNTELPRPVRVLVPIELDVLMVRQKGGVWADCRMQPATGSKDAPQPASDLLPGPFKELTEARERGAYLHWSLPNGLRAGQASKGSVAFPAIPERWLVLRLSPGDGRRAVRGWVLVADREPPTAIDLAAWGEPGANTALVNPLTALGHGDLSWTGYFDNVANRLAFHDALDDVRVGPIAYLVCGWYAADGNDPLADAAIRSLAQFNAKLAELGWSIPDYQMQEAADAHRARTSVFVQAGLAVRAADFAPPENAAFRPLLSDRQLLLPAEWWPRQTLYHGCCVAIGWPGVGWAGNENGLLSGEFGGPPDPSGVNLMLGNTVAEAMAAVVATANGTPQEAQVLEAFQLGLISDLDQPDGRARVDVQCHASGFGSLSGGVETVKFHRAASGPPPAAQPATETPGPGVFANRPRPHRFPPQEIGVAAVGLGDVAVVQGQSKQSLVEKVTASPFRSILQYVVMPEPATPAQDLEVTRPLPRFYFANDPVVLIEGAKRSVKWDDSRFSQDGTLACRLTGFVITATRSYAPGTVALGGPVDDRPVIGGEEVLENGIGHGAIPPECDDLLAECALFDPGSAAMIAAAAQRRNAAYGVALARIQGAAAGPVANIATAALVQNIMVEQTAWWATRDPRIDHAPIVANTAFAGVLPAALAVNLPVRPWHPIHLDWTVEYVPDPAGFAGWQLGEIDYTTADLPTAKPMTFSGRAPVTAAATRMMAAAVRNARDQLQRLGGTEPLPRGARVKFTMHVSDLLSSFYAAQAGEGGTVRDELTDIAAELDTIDVLTAAFDGLHKQLRAGFAPDGVAAPPQGGVPPGFVPLRAGFLSVVRLRLVDSFGQFVDLAGSSATKPADPQRIATTQAMATPGAPGIAALPPRFTAPARLWFRFVSAEDDTVEADDDHSPVCAYLMPNHIDDALEFLDPDGTNIGVVRDLGEDRGIAWEDAPGRPVALGADPTRALVNPHVAALAAALLRWGESDAGVPTRETVFSALRRAIDSTRWATDPYGHVGDEHLALLIGHPVVAVRAILRLELREPIPTTDTQVTPIRVRIGALTHWQDGLYAYFVDDDYTKLHVADAAIAGLARDFGPGRGFLQNIDNVAAYAGGFASDAAAQPIAHPAIDASGFTTLVPGQTVTLTMLVEPHTLVHATSGLLPRKDIGLRRGWIDAALKILAPTFRFGPVLVDPRRIRMPIPTDIGGTWSWDHRSNAVDWSDSGVTNATQDALLNSDPPIAQEGWLRLSPAQPPQK